MTDKKLKEIREALENTVTRVLGRNDEGTYVLLPKETVEYVLDLVDTQAKQIKELAEKARKETDEWHTRLAKELRNVSYFRDGEKAARVRIGELDKQIAEGREIMKRVRARYVTAIVGAIGGKMKNRIDAWLKNVADG